MDGTEQGSPLTVPSIIHQIWLDEHAAATPSAVSFTGSEEFEHIQNYTTLPSRYDAAHQSCVALHPGWEFKLWTSEAATSFVSQEYPSILAHYQSYRQTIQRTNILRYLVLHHYGGVYLDLDISCRQSLESLRSVGWLTPAAHPAGINNAFIISPEHHPFLTSLIARIESHDLWWPTPYVENMLSTGCMFISMEYARFGGWDKEAAGLHILALDGKVEPQMLRGHVVTPLFEHAGASSWHRWDGQMMLIAGQYWRALLALLALVMALITGACLWRLSRKSSRISLAKGGSEC